MTEEKKPIAEPSFEERKKALIAQGAERRREIDRSIDLVRDNLHADKLAKNAVTHLTTAAYGAVENMFGWHHLRGSSLGTNLSRFLPLASTAYSIISRRKLVVPVLRGAAVVAAVSTGGYFYWRHKHPAKTANATKTTKQSMRHYRDRADLES